MEVILQKTHTNGLIALNDADYAALPNQFVATVKDSGMTEKQRNALHVWCGQVAQVLNDNNLFYRYLHAITGVTIEQEWTKMLVKDYLYKPTLANLKGKDSTEKQSKVDPSAIAEAIARAFAIHSGIELPRWPSMRG